MSEFKQILPPTRLSSPATAGVYADFELPVTADSALDDEIQWLVLVHAVKSTSAALAFRVDHSPDGATTATHTTAAIAPQTVDTGTLLIGRASASTMRMDYVHPVLRVGSSGTGDQWLVAEVWQQRKRFSQVGNIGQTRRIGTFRLDGGSTMFTSGLPLPANDQGFRTRVVSYHVKVVEASASAQLGMYIQHGPDGQNWNLNKLHALASVSAGTLKVYDCDTDKVLGPYFRPRLHMNNSAGERVTVEVFETTKAV